MNGFEKSLSDFAPQTATRDARAPVTVLDWGLELRLWVATCVAGLSLFCTRSLGLPLDDSSLSAIGVVFFSTLALYNLDGSLDAPERGASATTWARAGRRRVHWIVTALSAMALFFFVSRLSTRALVGTSLGALACSLYALPLTMRRRCSSGAPALRLKSLPFFKAPFVGSAVGVATVWVPIWAQDARPSLAAAILLTAVLSLYCTDNALLFDIPDVREDTRSRIPTVPARWGLRATRRWSRTLALCGLGASGLYLWREPATVASGGLLALGLALVVFTELLDFRTSRRAVAFWVDGALLLPLSFQLLSGG